jgi:2-keto-4-pentenoate hydratase
VLGHDVRYGGDDLAAYEKQAAGMMPGWQAHDFRVMLRAMQRFGMVPGKDSRAIFEALLGHPLRSYRAFAEEAAASW